MAKDKNNNNSMDLWMIALVVVIILVLLGAFASWRYPGWHRRFVGWRGGWRRPGGVVIV